MHIYIFSGLTNFVPLTIFLAMSALRILSYGAG